MRKLFLIILLLTVFLTYKPGSAKAQACTVTPPTNTGRVTLSADTTAGTYRIWSRMKAADPTNNSFYIQIDSTCPVLVQNSNTAWAWVANQSNITLTAGTHVVTIIGNQPGVGVDKLLMTKNLTCTPTGMSGDNCPAEIIASPTVGATDTTSPVISSVTTAALTSTSVNIEWNLSEGGTGQIEYGKTTNYELPPTTLESNFLTFHSQSLSGLTPGTLYHYRIKSKDQAGNLATSNDFTFTTTSAITPSPTLTPIPTAPPTPLPNSTILRFNSVKFHGIGTGGDNTNPNLTGNLIPTRTSRTLTVQLIDSSGTSLPAFSGTITYKSATGDFSGDIIVDPSISIDSTNNNYLIKVKSPQYLKKQLIGIPKINKGSINIAPSVVLTTGDINNDNVLSVSDFNILMDCYSELLPAKNCTDANKKASADISDDGNVDKDDYNSFLRELSVVSGD